MPTPSLPASRPWKTALRVAALVFLLAAVVLLARSISLERPLAWLTEEVHAFGIWGPLAFAALYLVVTVFLLPGTPIVLAAGAVFGVPLGTVTISLASTLSAIFSFFLSRYVAHDWVAARVHHYPKLEAFWHALREREGWKLVAAVRLSHALPFGVQNLLFGLSPVRFWPFVAATVGSMLPGTLLYVYLGDLGARALGADDSTGVGVGGWGVRMLSLTGIALAVLYAGRLARRIVRERTHVDLEHDALRPGNEESPDRITGCR